MTFKGRVAGLPRKIERDSQRTRNCKNMFMLASLFSSEHRRMLIFFPKSLGLASPQCSVHCPAQNSQNQGEVIKSKKQKTRGTIQASPSNSTRQ